MLERYASKHQHRLFFIEDTSISIEALSAEKEFPGVDVKYWMRETSFEKLDETLKAHNNNRKVTVRSDIVLYLPPHLRESPGEIYKVFVGKTTGTVVEKEQDFKTNTLYPWLDNKTFNKWFVPQGAKKPISLLSINRAIKYDFRNKALNGLIDFLKSKDLIDPKNPYDTPTQGELFPRKNYIICGATCAGKTVLASALTRLYAYRHIEASDFMRRAFYERHGYKSEIKIQDFAKSALKSDPGIVARQICEYIKDTPKTGIVITGFRSPKEIEVLTDMLKIADIDTIFIQSNIDTRYERNKRRNRLDVSSTIEDFKKKNQAQADMGLTEIEKNARTLLNESSLISYIRDCTKSLASEAQLIPFKCKITKTSQFLQLEHSILISMLIEHKAGRLPLSTTQIAKSINKNIPHLRNKGGKLITTDKNNVSRFFNQKFSPHYEAEIANNKLSYYLSHTGISAAIALIRSISDKNSKSAYLEI